MYSYMNEWAAVQMDLDRQNLLSDDVITPHIKIENLEISAMMKFSASENPGNHLQLHLQR